MARLQSTQWQTEHRVVIDEFIDFINKKTDGFILKGGTALMKCYGLDRFSEDIDFDKKSDENLLNYIEDFCDEKGYTYRVAKDTETTTRAFINYGNSSRPLKIEVSARRKMIPDSETNVIDGISVYNIDRLCVMKSFAYSGRDKIRDLYDLTFICNNHYDALSETTLTGVRDVLEHKGIEQFDYLLRQEKDELINPDKLADDFINLHEKLGLLYDNNEKSIVEEFKKPKEQEVKIEVKPQRKPKL